MDLSTAPPTGLFASAAAAAYSTLRPHDRDRFDQLLEPGRGSIFTAAAAASAFLTSAVTDRRWADRVDPWWAAHADALTEALTFLIGCTVDEARALLTAAVYAVLAVGGDLQVAEVRLLAERAGSYLAGVQARTG